ncbi:PaeR7I family type II restriction endonuclease [Actinomadura sp. NPDC048021]|uniref:PaeR7I family type II restriction endonuclease n=1 Tax=Actinomadura sp. NPDC048021 TaxID=3155385 RepID=UPI0034074973
MAPTYDDFVTAVKAYWGVKEAQMEASKIANAVGAGTAGAIRSGKHFDPIAHLIAKFFVDAGFPASAIRVREGDRLELPGYYRPQKKWDLVVAYRDTLVAAFELKGLGAGEEGKGFAKNYNNRLEEALGSAVDLRRAELESIFPGEKPWLGYFFIMEDHPVSRTEKKERNNKIKPAFEVDPIWLSNSSYRDRYALFCKRVIDEGLYDSVCYITSSEHEPTPIEPSVRLDWQHFSAAINARITYLHDLGIPGPEKQTTIFD